MTNTSKKINPVVCATYVVLLMMPEMFMLNTHTWWDAPVATLFNILYYGVFSWALCTLVSLTGPKTERTIHTILQSVVAAYSISNVFMLIMFNRHWDAYSWQFLCETNGRESSEFISSYILSLPTLGILSVYILLFAAEIWLGRRAMRWRIFPSQRIPAVAFTVLCIVMIGQTVFFGPDVEANYDRVARFKSPIKRNAMWNIWDFATSSLVAPALYKNIRRR
jgi:glucan phosphoethanolaminetransferase (alkaline phosphatase superfamily)